MDGKRAILPDAPSQAEIQAVQGGAECRAAIERLSPEQRRTLLWEWRWWARPAQLAPDGDWRTWMILAGRGFGKTRAGAEWVRAIAEVDGRVRIALVAATLPEARAVMVEGESGLLSIAPPDHRRPDYEPSLRRLTWWTGAQAFLYSAAESETLRGPQHHFAWADEIAKWPKGIDAWDNLAMGLRLGRHPRTVATTSPRAVPLVRRLVQGAADGDGTMLTRGRTVDNRAGLAPSFVAAMQATYGRTLIGRRELDGEMIETIEGALWSRELLESCRIAAAPPPERRRRTVVAVDPPAGAGAASDACGIVAAVLADDDRAYVLADASVQGASPERWAQRVAETAAAWDADRVVAEANNGGAMVGSVLRAADSALPLTLVHAAQGKSARAEPVAMLYETGRVAHVGLFPELEDELAGLIAGGGYEGPGRSPDRADALVWALTELMLGRRAAVPGVRRL